MRKAAALALCLCVICLALSGCKPDDAGIGRSSNDILTYEPIDPAKTTLVVSATGNVYIDKTCDAFEKANPDVQIVTLDITGGVPGYKPLTQWLDAGLSPDVIFFQTGLFNAENVKKYLVNLSGEKALNQCDPAALNSVAMNGNVYMLPGPSGIFCMHYNKTMFAEHGWTYPKTFDGFLELCSRITEETDKTVVPFNPNAKYPVVFFKLLSAFCYEDIFSGIDNRTWFESFIDGKGTFKGHMEPFYEAAKKLADYGILTSENFSYSATARTKEFLAGEIAMVNMSMADMSQADFEIGYDVFPTTGKDAYISSEFEYFAGVPIKEHTDKEKDAIDRFLNFITGIEAQKLMANGRSMLSNTKERMLLGPEVSPEIVQAIESGRVFAQFDFAPSAVTTTDIYTGIKAMALEGKSSDDCIKDIDLISSSPSSHSQVPEAIARAKTDFTILETSSFLCDMYRERAGADIALIANNIAYRGNLMRIFKGDLNSYNVTVLKPRSFANNSTLVKAEMTGRQIINALNNPVGNSETANCIYAFSGLKCVVEPWKPLGQKYASVALSNGSKLEEDKVYTVAFWEGSVFDEYIDMIVETYPESFEELLTQKLVSVKEIEPAKDGRITLKWNR